MFPLSHCNHFTSFVLLCDFSWVFLWCSWEKDFWQYWQLNGRSPVWVFR